MGLSCCFAVYSFVVFFAASSFREIIHDSLNGRPPPAFANLVDFFAPIGFLIFLYPVLIGLKIWRYSENCRLSFTSFLTHFLLLGLALVAFCGILVAYSFLVYLDGLRPVSVIQIIGNILIGITLTGSMIYSFVRRRPGSEDSP